MKTWLAVFIIAFCGIFNALCPAMADELHLSNGDVITGQIIRMEGNKLIFETGYAGEMSVMWSQVINLISDDPIKVILTDGTVLDRKKSRPSK
jgi:ribosomal protein S1